MNLENIVQDHEERIVKLEKNAEETKNQYLRLENTVLQGNQRQEALLNKLIDHHFSFKQHKWTTIAAILGAGGSAVLLLQWVLTKL